MADEAGELAFVATLADEASAQARAVRATLESVGGDTRPITVPIDAEAESFMAELAAIDAQVAAINDTTATVTIDVDEAKRQLSELERQVKGRKLELDVQTSAARKRIAELQAQIAAARTAIALDADDTAARARLDQLQADLRNTRAQLQIDTAPAKAELEAMRAEVAARKLDLNVAVDRGSVLAEVAALDAEVSAVLDEQHTVKVDVDQDTIALASRGVSSLGLTIAALAPAAVPVLAAVTAGVGALGVGLAGAAGAGGILGLSVGGVIAQMTEAQKEVDALTTKLESQDKGSAEYAETLAELKDAQADMTAEFGPAAAGLEAVKSSWKSFMKATKPATVQLIGKALQVGADALGQFAPVANAAATAVGGVIDQIGQWVNGAGFRSLVSFLQTEGPGYITSFASIAGNVLSGVGRLFAAFAPITDRVLAGLESITGSFAGWAGALSQTDGFRSFLQYVEDTAPKVGAFLSSLVGAVGNLVRGLAPLGGPVLAALTAVFDAITMLPPGVITALATGMAAFAAAAAAAGGALSVYTAAAKIAVFLTSPLTLAVLALAGVAAAFVVAYRKSEAFRDTVNGAVESVRGKVQALWDFLVATFGPGSDFAAGAAATVENMREDFDELKTNAQAAATDIGDAWAELDASFKANSGGISLAQFTLGLLIAQVQTLGIVFSGIAGAVGGGVNAFVSYIGQMVTGVIGIVTGMLNFFAGVGGTLQAIFFAPMSEKWGLLKENIGLILTGLGQMVIGLFQFLQAAIVGPVQALVQAIIGFFRNLYDVLVGHSIVPDLVNAIIRWFGRLPGALAAKVAAAASAVIARFASMASTAQARASAMVARVVAYLGTLPGRAVAALSSLAGRVGNVVTTAGTRMRTAMSQGISNVVALASGLPGQVVGAIGGLGGLLVGAGGDLISGLISGINGMVGSLLSRAASIANQVASTIKGALKVRSPSRVMIEIGRYVGQGLVIGLTGSQKAVKSAADKLANQINDAFRKYASERGALNKTLAKQKAALQRALADDDTSRKTINNLRRQVQETRANIKALVASYGRVPRTAAAGLVAYVRATERSLSGLAKSRESLTKGLASARATLAAQVKVRDEYAVAVRDQLLSYAKLSTITVENDAPITAGFLLKGLNERLAAIRAFATNLAILRKRGLNGDLLRQLEEGGVEGSGEQAKALAAATTQQLKQLDTTQKAISSAARSTGNTAALAWYQAGIEAQRGVVKGLTTNLAAVDAAAKAIAKRLTTVIKKSLGIKSPSRVMRDEVGVQMVAGVTEGLLAESRAAESAAAAMAARVSAAAIPDLVGLAAQANSFAPSVTVSSSEVVTIRHEVVSPDGTVSKLTAEQIADLIARDPKAARALEAVLRAPRAKAASRTIAPSRG